MHVENSENFSVEILWKCVVKIYSGGEGMGKILTGEE